MNYQVLNTDAEPFVFMPNVNWETFKEPNIINAYWHNSLFFWSEEHAREYRKQKTLVDGIYLTMEQSVYAIPIAQSALFGFSK